MTEVTIQIGDELMAECERRGEHPDDLVRNALEIYRLLENPEELLGEHAD